MNTTPTYYADISNIALNAKEKYNLTDTQTLLYNHICRGDFYLRNETGQKFYDKEHKGFGHPASRDWVKKQFQPLIKAGLVKFKSLNDCRDARYTSWYFYDPKYKLEELIDANCYVSTKKLALIKHYLNLADGFEKQNIKYNDVEFIYEKNRGYTFKYKGQDSMYFWWDGEITSTSNHILFYENFDRLICDLWSFMEHDGKKFEMINIPNYTRQRRFYL
jgi:hypothetical protein